MQLSNEIKVMIEKSKWPRELEKIILLTDKELREKEIKPTTIQWQVLINHLSEMINRSKSGVELQDIDLSLFENISSESVEIATLVSKEIGELNEEEIYVLSIHFEMASAN